MQKTKKLELIVSVLLKGTGMTGKLLSKYCEILLKGLILKVSYHDIEYNKLSREERDLFSVGMVNGLIQTLKLNKSPKNKHIEESMLIEAVLEANPDFKRVMHQLIRWIASYTGEERQQLGAFLVTVMCRSNDENVAFGNLRGREFVLDNMDSLFGILPGVYYNDKYQFSLQVGDRFKTFGVVKENEQLFKDVFDKAVSKMPQPKPEAETESVDDSADISAEFNVDSAEFPEIKKVTKPPPTPVEVAKPSPAPVEVAKPTEEDELRKMWELLDSNVPDNLKLELMRMRMRMRMLMPTGN